MKRMKSGECRVLTVITDLVKVKLVATLRVSGGEQSGSDYD